jgi:hypothetical protein
MSPNVKTAILGQGKAKIKAFSINALQQSA